MGPLDRPRHSGVQKELKLSPSGNRLRVASKALAIGVFFTASAAATTTAAAIVEAAVAAVIATTVAAPHTAATVAIEFRSLSCAALMLGERNSGEVASSRRSLRTVVNSNQIYLLDLAMVRCRNSDGGCSAASKCHGMYSQSILSFSP